MNNVNNQNPMQRHEQIIQLSNHVKNKLKQHHRLPGPSSFIESSDEFIEITSTDDDNGKRFQEFSFFPENKEKN